MRNLHLIITLCFAVGAASAGTPGGGGGGGGGGHGAGGASAAAHGSSTSSTSSNCCAAHVQAAIGTRIGSSLGMRSATSGVESISRATVAGREAWVATVKLGTPLTDSDREYVRFHGFSKQHMYGGKQAQELWCPDTLLARQRGTPTCVAFSQ